MSSTVNQTRVLEIATKGFEIYTFVNSCPVVSGDFRNPDEKRIENKIENCDFHKCAAAPQNNRRKLLW